MFNTQPGVFQSAATQTCLSCLVQRLPYLSALLLELREQFSKHTREVDPQTPLMLAQTCLFDRFMDLKKQQPGLSHRFLHLMVKWTPVCGTE